MDKISEGARREVLETLSLLDEAAALARDLGQEGRARRIEQTSARYRRKHRELLEPEKTGRVIAFPGDPR